MERVLDADGNVLRDAVRPRSEAEQRRTRDDDGTVRLG